MSVAQTILDQLGGKRFCIMTGAKNFVGSKDSLRFRINGKGPDGRVNVVSIKLEADDTYTFETFYLRKMDFIPRGKFTSVYCDMLEETFERSTGLYTRL